MTNSERAQRAQRGRNAIDAYCAQFGADEDAALRDLLADLMHMAAEDDIDLFENECQMARIHFDAECEETKCANS